MTFKFKEKLNKKLWLKKVGVAFVSAAMLLSVTACGTESAKDGSSLVAVPSVKLPGALNSGSYDGKVLINIDDGEMEEVFYYIPSDETMGSDKVSTIKLLGASADKLGAQASYETLLSLKNQASSGNNKPSTKPSDKNENKNENVTLITPDDKLNFLIQNNKYSSNTVTVIQSERNDLSEDVDALMAAIKSNSRCDAGFLAIRISDGASIGYNVDKQWRCMSTFKAPTALYAYKLASEGKLSLSDTMTYVPSKYYYPGSGVIKNGGSGIKYSIKTLISYSILHSDNSAYIMLRDYLSTAGIEQMVKDMGCDNYELSPENWPDVSVRDAALWWNEIYNFCRTDSYGSSLYTTFVNATGNMIDKALGYEYEVAHKSGSGKGYHHDCAIVMADEPYILILYTSNSSGAEKNYTYMSKIIREINEIMVG